IFSCSLSCLFACLLASFLDCSLECRFVGPIADVFEFSPTWLVVVGAISAGSFSLETASPQASSSGFSAFFGEGWVIF
ncbi:MAG: hypothetical protein LBT62_07290, partial [Deltaproteobacteria bacterium]|nr:hypothetical protein [Deltaproteobacteria bacterium]